MDEILRAHYESTIAEHRLKQLSGYRLTDELMAQVILNLPLGRGRPKSRYHDLFAIVSDGKPWRIGRDEYIGSTNNFRLCLQGWARHRDLKAITRTAENGDMFVQVEPIV
jgi:hypothetical protein